MLPAAALLVLAPKLWQLHGSGNWYGEEVFHLSFGTYIDSFLLSSDGCFTAPVNGLGSLIPIFCVQTFKLQRVRAEGAFMGQPGLQPGRASTKQLPARPREPGGPGSQDRARSHHTCCVDGEFCSPPLLIQCFSLYLVHTHN